MFESVFHPLHRCAGFARRQTHQHDVGEDGLLHAKASAGVSWQAMTQFVARDLEGQGHHRVQRERPHKIGHDVVALVAGQMFCNHYTALDRRTTVARKVHGQRHAVWGLLKRAGRIAVSKAAIRNDVASNVGMQHDASWVYCALDINDRRQGAVFSAHSVDCILCQVAVFGNDYGNRFSDIANAIDRECPVLHWLLDADDEWL